MFRTLRAIRFLFTGPIVLLIVFIVSRMTPAGDTWFHWAALGLCIAWVFSLLRVIQAVIVVGGIAALVAYLKNRA